ncbi:site-specific integrase [Oxalobacteraceae sp. CFBP 8763]|nr:site-specific integrase [Oxalobacteraceae sp. CFBP 8763]
MKFTVYYSDPTVTSAAGFGRVAHLPCIFDNRPGYHRLASRYLIDRGLGLWNPTTRSSIHKGHLPTDQTIRNYAHWLVNFLEWAEIRGIDIDTCTYREHIQGRYQAEMLCGMWSSNGKGLSPRTVNLRVQQACDYLLWLEDNGHRTAFYIPYIYKTQRNEVMNSTGTSGATVKLRRGKVLQGSRSLHMPTLDLVKIWLASVYRASDYTMGLMCETVLLTGLRREETACLRLDTIPDPIDWHISNPDAPESSQKVQIEVKYGTKGPCFGYENGDKIGPRRWIWIPLHLANRLYEYRMKVRNKGLKIWVNAASTIAEKNLRIKNSVHLFIDEKSGRRLTARHLYFAWTKVPPVVKGWSPHKGRHWWACTTLMQEMLKHERLLELGIGTATALLESNVMTILRLQIQPQLGHSSDSTTMIYVKWAVEMFGDGLPNILEEIDRVEENGIPK